MISLPAARIGAPLIYASVPTAVVLGWILVVRILVPDAPPPRVSPVPYTEPVVNVTMARSASFSDLSESHVPAPAEPVPLAAPGGGSERRLDAIAALAESPDPRATGFLRALLDDPDVGVRETAVEAMGLRLDTAAIAGLGYALADPDPAVRELAIEVIAELGTAEAAAMLSLTLDDPDPGIRRRAAERLAALPGSVPRSVLQRFAADPEPSIRRIAASAGSGAG